MILTAITWTLKRNSSRSNNWFADACVGFCCRHKPNPGRRIGVLVSTQSHALYVSRPPSMHLISHVLHPLNHIPVSMSITPLSIDMVAPQTASSAAVHELKLQALQKESKIQYWKSVMSKGTNSEHTSEGELHTGDESGEDQPSNTAKRRNQPARNSASDNQFNTSAANLEKIQNPLTDLTGWSSDIHKNIFKNCVWFIWLSVFDENIRSIYRFRTVPNVL